jgi:beta-fructofuranosidase
MNRRRLLQGSAAASALLALRAPLARGFAGQNPETAELHVALRKKLMADPLRPQFHLLPKANWMNDPCAPRFFGGKYHMFFQYNPNAAEWGDMHWNHAVSPDLIHWEHLPVALAPTPGSFDAFGIFTGSVLPGMEVPTVLYTGVSKSSEETIRGEGLREVQCLATSTDPELRVWKKLDKPVIASPPPGVKVTGFRDPCPWKDGDTWYLGVGSGFTQVGGAVLLYRSHDGHNWEYLHPLAQGTWNGGGMSNPVDTGEMWECPDFFPLGGKHVLLYSVERKVYWEVGTFDKSDLKFHSENRGLLDHGFYYAMKSMEDAKGRRILWGWVEEDRSSKETLAAGWAGAMALPRVLTLTADNSLKMEVPPEFSTLCRETGRVTSSAGADLNGALARLPIANRAGRIGLQFRPTAANWSLELRGAAAPDSTPLLAIRYDGAGNKPAISIGEKSLTLTPDAQGISTVDLWMDGSVIEIFADSRQALTARCYQAAGDIHAAWTGTTDALKTLTVSAVRPISPDRLTS